MLAVEELYRQEIRSLPAADRLQLLALIAQELVVVQVRTTRRITELRGLGKEIWQDIDAQQYVDALRNEWDTSVCPMHCRLPRPLPPVVRPFSQTMGD